MLEHQFIKQKQQSWTALEEQIYKRKSESPERLAESFVEVTEDLSFSRTYYPYRLVRVYLNNMARSFFGSVYKNKKLSGKGIIDFWKTELPMIIFSCRKSFLTAFVVFMLAAAIGVFSTYQDPTFANHMLGAEYMDMTRENIKSGDPMAVYKKANDELPMFLQITLNNIKVAFLAFVSGIVMGIGSLLVLLYNGIMLGCFQFYFIQQDLARESILAIWMHGTLEISSVVISGAAGLEMGKGLIFPGSYTRLQSLRLSSIKGLKILLSTVPLFIVAGFVEGFLTRQTEIGDIIRALFILVCAAFIVGYYILYPRFVAQNPELDHSILDEGIEAPHPEKPNFYGLYNTGQLFTDSINRMIKSLKGISFILIIGALTASIWVLDANVGQIINNEKSVFLGLFFGVYKLSGVLISLFQSDMIKVVSFSVLQILLFCQVNIHDNPREPIGTVVQKEFKQFVQGFIILLIHNLLLLPEASVYYYCYLLLMPFVYMSIVILFHEKANLNYAITNAWHNCISGYQQLIYVYFLIGISSYIILALLNAPLIKFAEEFISMNLEEEAPFTETILRISAGFPLIAGLLLAHVWAFSGAVALNKQSYEIRTGHFLHKKIKTIALRKNGSRMITALLVMLFTFALHSQTFAAEKFSKEKWKEATKDISYNKEEPNNTNYKMPSGGFDLSEAKYIVWAIIIIIVVILIMLLINNLSDKRRIFPKQQFAYDAAGSIKEEFSGWSPSQIDAALAAGDYKSAIRLTYIGMLLQLCDKKLLLWHKEKTNKEYLKELHNTRIKHGFRDLTRKYEIAWFGDKSVFHDDYQQFTSVCQQISQNISDL